MTVKELKDFLSQYPDNMKVMQTIEGEFYDIDRGDFMKWKNTNDNTEFLTMR